MLTDKEKLESVLYDLHELEKYLRGRSEKTRALSLKFAENAKKDLANKDFDLNQSRMLDYQHEVWNEIGNLIEKLVKKHE